MFSPRKIRTLLLICIFIPLLPQLHAQWVKKNTGLSKFIDATAIDACNDSTAVICTNLGIFLTTNGGNLWQHIPYPPGAPLFGMDIEIMDSLNIWIGEPNGEIYNTSDKGQNWTLQFKDTTLTKFINYIEMFDFNNGIAMGDCTGNFNGSAVILRTTDGGKHWMSMNDSSFGGASGNIWRRIDFLNNGVGYFKPINQDNSIWKTTDFGENWIKTSYGFSGGAAVIKFYNENIGFVTDYGGLARTLDGGNTWDHWDSPFSRSDIEFAPDDPANVWLLGDDKVFFTSDTGNTWKSVSINGFGMAANNEGRDMVFTSRQNGWLLSEKNVYKTTNGGGLTNVAQLNSHQPEIFLFQNYPNPFNPYTEIRYQIRKTSHVTIKIYDLLGQEVTTLVDGNVDAGTHDVRWNARNRENTPVSTGIYVYRLNVDKEVFQRKMALIR